MGGEVGGLVEGIHEGLWICAYGTRIIYLELNLDEEISIAASCNVRVIEENYQCAASGNSMNFDNHIDVYLVGRTGSTVQEVDTIPSLCFLPATNCWVFHPAFHLQPTI